MEWNEISYTHSFQIMDLYDDGKKMTKSESVDHISENDHTQDPCDYGLVGGYALPALHSILNQKGTENIGHFCSVKLQSMRSKFSEGTMDRTHVTKQR